MGVLAGRTVGIVGRRGALWTACEAACEEEGARIVHGGVAEPGGRLDALVDIGGAAEGAEITAAAASMGERGGALVRVGPHPQGIALPPGVTLHRVEIEGEADAPADRVGAVVAWLASELGRCSAGWILAVEGDTLRIGTPARDRVVHPGAGRWSAHGVAATAGSEPPAAPPEGLPVGKRYDGGAWWIDREAFEAYAAATDDPNPAYRGPQAVAPPMFHVRPIFGLMMACAKDPELGLDLLRLVHGEHAMRFLRPLRHGDVLRVRGVLEEAEDKPSGRVVTFGITGTVDGELALEGRTTYFIRAKTRPEGARKKAAPPTPPPPDATVAQPVAEDQARRYADASGDHNPIHLDPEVAKKAGLPGVILHGLCTMAFAQRDLIARYGGGDPTRLEALSVRFARPVFPGETLTLRIWEGEDALTFETHNSAGKAVIVGGRAVLRPAGGR